MVFIADDLGAWLVGLLADAGRRKLTNWVLGSDQERALRQAATAAVARIAADLRPDDTAQAEQVAMVVSQVFSEPTQTVMPDRASTLLEAFRSGIATQLAILDDPNLTGTGLSSADLLGVPAEVLTERLTGQLLQEIVTRASRGGPLFPLASELNHDMARAGTEQLKGMVGEALAALERLESAHIDTGGLTDPAHLSPPLTGIAGGGEHQRVSGQQPNSPAFPIIVGDVPQRPVAFQSRERILNKLKISGPESSRVYVLTGMRGAGKTQIAAAYARACIENGWRVVAWLNAANTTKMLSGLKEIANALGVGSASDNLANKATAVRHFLEVNGGQCLLVFDDVNTFDDLRSYLPTGGEVQVVITSSRNIVSSLGLSIPVDTFTEAEALAFLKDRVGRLDPVAAPELAHELGYLPLALAQAAALLAFQHLDYSTYLSRFRKLRVDEYLTCVEEDPYPVGVAASVLLSMDAVEGKDDSGICHAVINFMAVLSAYGLPRNFFHLAAQIGALTGARGVIVGPEVVDSALGNLNDVSLLTFGADGDAVQVHRLVARIVRERSASEGTLPNTARAALKVFESVASSLDESWKEAAAAQDVIAMIQELHGHLRQYFGELDITTSERLLGLCNWAIYSLCELGDNPAEAVRFGELLASDCDRILGPDHKMTLLEQGNLAYAYRLAGMLPNAIKLHERDVKAKEQLFDADDPDLMKARNNLGLAYREAGRLDEAIEMFERTLADRQRLRGDDHPETMRSRNNLAMAYEDVGRLDEAIEMFERTLADRQRLLGDDHPETMHSRNNLAGALQHAHRSEAAIVLFERSLADRQRLRGDLHPETVRARNNLAGAYLESGLLSQAMELYGHALADARFALGDDQPDTRFVLQNINMAYAHPGISSELREQTLMAYNARAALIQQAVYRRDARNGNVDAMYHLSTALMQEDPAEATQWLCKAADAGHIEAMYKLSSLLRKAGQTSEAMQLLLRVAEAGHLDAMYNYGVLLREDGRTSEAEPWWRHAADLGDAQAMYNLGIICHESGRFN